MGVFEHWPNRITALRFVGALALFGLFAIQGNQSEEQIRGDRMMLQSAFWLFIVTAASDVLDGYLARRGNLVSDFGRIADPFVDKVLVIGAMVFLAVMPWSQKWFSAWIVVVIIAREFLITGLRGYVESRGAKFPADWFGKVKMFSQCLAVGIVLGLFAFEWSQPAFAFWSSVGHVFVWATLLTSLGSCFSYLVKTRRIVLETTS